MTLEMFVRPWEKLVMSMRFTEVCLTTAQSGVDLSVNVNVADSRDQLGAIRYERDVRGVANYLSAQTSFGGAREKFTRLQQISTVLNLDEVSYNLDTTLHCRLRPLQEDVERELTRILG